MRSTATQLCGQNNRTCAIARFINRDGVNSQRGFKMTEQNLGEANQYPVEALVSETSAPIATSAPAVAPSAPKMFTQEQVNDIVGRTRREVRENYTHRISDNANSQANVQQAQTPAQPQAAYTPEQIQKMVDDRVQQQNQHAYLQNFSQNLNTKMQTEREQDAGFRDVEAAINLPGLSMQYPHFVLAVGNLDNTGQVMRELHKNPATFSTLLQLMSNQATQPMGIQQLQALSSSIKSNQAAVEDATRTTPNSPLSQVRTSVNTPDNGNLSVSDLRKQTHLRA
jgi:hypothetical protein